MIHMVLHGIEIYQFNPRRYLFDMVPLHRPAQIIRNCTVGHLRILVTTDLHGHLLPHDYIKDRATQGGGLAGLAHLIARVGRGGSHRRVCWPRT